MLYGPSHGDATDGGLLQLDAGEWWLLALVIGTVVLVVVAVLLGLVIAVLQRIDRHAARVFTVGKQISENTVALWTLEQTDRISLPSVTRPEGSHQLGRPRIARRTLAWVASRRRSPNLTAKLTGINQYFIDAKLLEDWSLPGLAKLFRVRSFDEMRDARSSSSESSTSAAT
jgi:hypothetical protein